MSDTYLGLSVSGFLDELAAKQPAPGGGAVAATAASMAAALVGMAARYADGRLQQAGELAGRADTLRSEAGLLTDRDAAAYGEVAAAYRMPREPDPQARQEAVRAALRGATDVPLDIARVAAEIGELAARLADEGNPNLRGDAVTATLVADAAARAAADLVRINVESGGLDPELIAAADTLIARTEDSVHRSGAR